MILVINSGSSSIKFQLYKAHKKDTSTIAQGLIERIGIDGKIKIKYGDEKKEYNINIPTHFLGIKNIFSLLEELKIITDIKQIKAVGFRVVHGGDIRSASLITDEVYKKIQESTILAPLHNPAALVAIDSIKLLLPKAVLVACFDTAFHQSLDPREFLYPVPYEWYEKYGVRKYGFHGISYQYVLKEMEAILEKPTNKVNLIICHLGNGASISCIKNSKSIDTSMGFTPLDGLMMGSRSGAIDPSIVQYIHRITNENIDNITGTLNNDSGVKGLSQTSGDMRDLLNKYETGDSLARITFDKYTQIAADYIVKYANKLEGDIDAIVFTAGIGENSVRTRKGIITKVKLLNTWIDTIQNKTPYSHHLRISTINSEIPIYVIRTNEEKMISLETLEKL
ncbi:acetate kinase [[Acholeplasma] multilocale]|uniref:acetate kinase n=1 Tax=[Acholeplasma] multilocale TaxID=264638 RepID=UPI000478B83F|nr:acetate kinase [[Acholeplasma] multilocale]